MIQSFRDRTTLLFFEGHRVAAFQGFAHQAERRLTYLDNAESVMDLAALRGNRLDALKGDRAGQQWRLCFRWEHDGPHDVEIVDYH